MKTEELRGEIERALVQLMAEDGGKVDPFTDRIVQALKLNTRRAMEQAAKLWREYRDCCQWMNAGEAQMR